MPNNQTSLSELGYVAYRSENDDGIIICPKDIPYDQRLSNIKFYLSRKELDENNTALKTMTLILSKLDIKLDAK